MMAALLFADKLLGLAPLVLTLGGDVLSAIANGRTALQKMSSEKRDPTDEEWAALNATIDALMAQLKG